MSKQSIPEEPRANELLERMHGQREGSRLYCRLWHQQARIQKKYNAEMRARGKACAVCGQHYVPKRIDQTRCPDCLAKARALAVPR